MKERNNKEKNKNKLSQSDIHFLEYHERKNILTAVNLNFFQQYLIFFTGLKLKSLDFDQ